MVLWSWCGEFLFLYFLQLFLPFPITAHHPCPHHVMLRPIVPHPSHLGPSAALQCSEGTYVACVKQLFEWEIHGSANLTPLCCVLRVTWCHCVRFLCYVRQKLRRHKLPAL